MIYRRRLRAAYFFVLALITFLVALAVLTSGDMDAFGLVLCSAICGWSALVLIQTFRVAVIATASDVTIRNWLTTTRLLWSEVARISVPPPYGTFRSSGIRFELTSGEVVSAAAFTRGPFDGPQLAVKVVSDLEELRSAAAKAPDSAAGAA